MEILTNFEIIDCILVGIIVLFSILGLKRGFILCAYNFFCTLICLLGAYICTNSTNSALDFVLENQYIQVFEGVFKDVLVFIIFFFLLSFLVKIVSLVIKPILNGIVQHIIIIKQVNQLLGLLLGFIRGIIYAYVIILVLVLPIFEGGQTMISNSIIANKVLEVVPIYSEQIIEMYF